VGYNLAYGDLVTQKRFRAQTYFVCGYCRLPGTFLSEDKPCKHLIASQLGSALCGAAQSMIWLVIARAVQGLGGGGIMQMVQITISDIVSLQEYVIPLKCILDADHLRF
jgi:MFS family permease